MPGRFGRWGWVMLAVCVFAAVPDGAGSATASPDTQPQLARQPAARFHAADRMLHDGRNLLRFARMWVC